MFMLSSPKCFKKRNGQSLVEVIVAIGVLNVGLFSVWALFLSNYSGEQEAEMRMGGINLAREGAEIVKNIRDSNWLKVESNILDNGNPWRWDRGLAGGVGSVNYQSTILEDQDKEQLYLNQDGFYTNETTNQNSPYRREIILRDICCSDGDYNLKCDNNNFQLMTSPDDHCTGDGELKIGIDVQSIVNWQMKGKPRRVIVQDQIFNWK